MSWFCKFGGPTTSGSAKTQNHRSRIAGNALTDQSSLDRAYIAAWSTQCHCRSSATRHCSVQPLSFSPHGEGHVKLRQRCFPQFIRDDNERSQQDSVLLCCQLSGFACDQTDALRFELTSLHILHVQCQFCVIRAVGRNLLLEETFMPT